jgi:hypothetical protein
MVIMDSGLAASDLGFTRDRVRKAGDHKGRHQYDGPPRSDWLKRAISDLFAMG